MATLTGEPLYARFGFGVKARFELKRADEIKFPAVVMPKNLEIFQA